MHFAATIWPWLPPSGPSTHPLGASVANGRGCVIRFVEALLFGPELLAARITARVRSKRRQCRIDLAHQAIQLPRILRTRIIHVNFFFQRLVLVIAGPPQADAQYIPALRGKTRIPCEPRPSPSGCSLADKFRTCFPIPILPEASGNRWRMCPRRPDTLSRDTALDTQKIEKMFPALRAAGPPQPAGCLESRSHGRSRLEPRVRTSAVPGISVKCCFECFGESAI